MPQNPILAIPLGDAAGVGPELVAKTLLDSSIRARCRPLVLGQRWVLEQALALIGAGLPLRVVSSASEAEFDAERVDVLEIGKLDPAAVEVGKIRPATGHEGGATLFEAARLVGAGVAHGLVSAPISKAAAGMGGFTHGHMEIAAQALGYDGPIYSALAGPRLTVVNMTGHCSVAEAIAKIKADLVTETLRLMDVWFRLQKQDRFRIAVCALNPHGGESGVFGREEIEQIAPGVAAARDLGVDAHGPLPVDTLFARILEGGAFDAVLAMHHDQGFTAVKTVAVHETASIGLGLPIVYATTDHGTAFDIAGKGVANPGSMLQATRFVIEACGG